jgi:hypothetical protein
MSTETVRIAVLRALLRLARRRTPATLADLLARVSLTEAGGEGEVERALASLARQQLVQRSGETASLSLAGLAVALAVVANAKTERASRASAKPTLRVARAERRVNVAPGASVIPMVGRTRRHRAA